MNCPVCGVEHRRAYVRFTIDDAPYNGQAFVRPAMLCRELGMWFIELKPGIQGLGVDMLPLKMRDCEEVNPATVKPEDIAPPEPIVSVEDMPEELL